MSDNKNVNQDKGLQGNEKIEQAITTLQQEATQEMLAHTLTAIRRRMRENGQFILSVELPTGDNQLRIGTVKTGDDQAVGYLGVVSIASLAVAWLLKRKK